MGAATATVFSRSVARFADSTTPGFVESGTLTPVLRSGSARAPADGCLEDALAEAGDGASVSELEAGICSDLGRWKERAPTKTANPTVRQMTASAVITEALRPKTL
jgi:hypothetical protein